MPEPTHPVFCLLCILLVIGAGMAAGCSSGPASPAPAGTAAPAGGENTILIENFAFSPSALTVKSGTVVTWLNRDGTSHTVVSDPASPEAFSSDPLPNNASFSFTFTRPGTYPFHCSIHPSMKGTIVVQP
jgi:plastocyanin